MKKLSINRVIWYLSCSDIANWGIYMSVISLLGIYLTDRLGPNTVQYLGIGTAIYAIARAGAQIPFGVITDRFKGDRDEILFLLIGNFLMGGSFLMYPLVYSPAMYFLIQLLFGLGAGINLVTWRKLFARHLDKGQEGVEYGAYETIMSIMMAIFGAVTGTLARISLAYFEMVIVGVGVLILSSVIWPLLIYHYNKLKEFRRLK